MLFDRRLNVAPMMDVTHRHCRYLLRLLSPHAVLYTEMITTGALLFGDAQRFLAYDEAEHPLALQLGGHDAEALAKCAIMAAEQGYDEINLNVGCPSNRVQAGMIGACLFKHPDIVAKAVQAMRDVVDIPVTVKTRLGVDEHDSYQHLSDFTSTMVEAGCDILIIHARKAWLQGLNPKQNRTIPELHYERLQTLKADFPQITIIGNGGIDDLDKVSQHLDNLHGVMLGRKVQHDPYFLAHCEQAIYGTPLPTRESIVERYIPYVEQQLAAGVYLSHLVKPLIGLYQGCYGAKRWRRYISEQVCQHADSAHVLKDASQLVNQSLAV